MSLTIGLVGMPGAGKGVIAAILGQNGFAVVSMGDIVRNLSRGPTAADQIALGKKLRAERGPAIMAQLAWQELGSFAEDVDYRGYVIDGIRNVEEHQWFRNRKLAYCLAHVQAPAPVRYNRLATRIGRSLNEVEARQRDRDELATFGLQAVINLADVVIDNSDALPTFNQLVERLDLR